ncbi:MAG: dihydroxy-acid dehydratase [Ancalomicrobiaceae bacterium]|nr:dihydroxy-acid dehydratase [Ancalomicrobiaceae bacterium]
MDAKAPRNCDETRRPTRHLTDGTRRASRRAVVEAICRVSTETRWPPAAGGPIGAALHLPATASEAGVDFGRSAAAEVVKRTSGFANSRPGGKYVAKNSSAAGGMAFPMKTLPDLRPVRGECLTVTGRTIAENPEYVGRNDEQDVIRPADMPIVSTGGVIGVEGNLASEGAVDKVAGMKNLKFTGAVVGFDREEDCSEAAIERRRAKDVVFMIGDEGLRRSAGRHERPATAAAHTTTADWGHGVGRKVATVTNGRVSGATPGGGIGHVGPEAAVGEPVALRRDSDIIDIDAIDGTLNARVCDTEFTRRRAEWAPWPGEFRSRAVWIIAQGVGSARTGAVAHPGARGEISSYAEI